CTWRWCAALDDEVQEAAGAVPPEVRTYQRSRLPRVELPGRPVADVDAVGRAARVAPDEPGSKRRRRLSGPADDRSGKHERTEHAEVRFCLHAAALLHDARRRWPQMHDFRRVGWRG